MQIKFTSKGSTLIISISGEIDHHSAEYVRQKIDAEILKATTKNIIFDFTKLGFMDSSGIGIIIGRYKNIRKLNGKAAIAGTNPHIRRILDISGVLKVIPAYDSVTDAVNILGK